MSEEQVMETLRLRTAALHRVCLSLDEWRDRAEKAEAALGHVCDGDCQATAEWRQQQIRDLTERAEKAERKIADVWEEGAKWAAVECGVIACEHVPWLAPSDNPYRAALGDAS